MLGSGVVPSNTYEESPDVASKLVWCTDIHLDFLRPYGAQAAFGEYLGDEYPDAKACIITGDISETPTLENHLGEFEEGFQSPVYFVLGNHEYYKGSFEKTEKIASNFYGWLERHNSIEVTKHCALIGTEGWYDGLAGFPKARFAMSDWTEIKDLKCLIDRDHLLSVCQTRSDSLAKLAAAKIEKAFETYKLVIFATHYPPFEGACWHEGQVSDNLHLPWFTSILMGRALEQVAKEHPNNKLLVLCGHTHSSGVYDHLPNLKVLTGEAVYGAPDVAGVLTVKGSDCVVTMKVNKTLTEVTF